jgi:hypothetical protein
MQDTPRPFGMEIMSLKPSFARKPNQDGFTPSLHLALQKQAVENDPVLQRKQTILVNRLLNADREGPCSCPRKGGCDSFALRN